MGSLGRDQLHAMFFPFMAHGHIIPTVDMAKLFASRGVKSTIITTPLNAQTISKAIQKTRSSGFGIDIRILKFPAREAGLPEGCENMDVIISSHDLSKDLILKFFLAVSMLKEPLENLLQECKPNCLVADMFFPWATDAAAKFGIPRLVFHGISFFSLCTAECLKLYEPHKRVSSDSEPFVIPYLPGEIEFIRKQLPDSERVEEEDNGFFKMLKQVRESEEKSYGVVVNSFYELESVYADFYRNELGRKAWHIGPLSLHSRGIDDKSRSGREKAIDEHECLKWLDSKKPNSVIYVCFGSLSKFTNSQLMELATALEASGQQFIWVVRRDENSQEDNQGWLPQGFEERTKGKGMIIRGWAPQVLILDHEAIGGFITHCGWNSTLEAITAGKPMVTWPLAAEQFYNEKLVNQVLKIGTGVGAKEWVRFQGDNIKSEAIEKAIGRVMRGEEAKEMRSRAKKLAEAGRRAVEEGGSSNSDFNTLVEELRWHSR